MKLACRVGRHRWTWRPTEDSRDLGDQALRCFDCGRIREPGRRPACWVGLHRWVRITPPEKQHLRKCLFCRRTREIRAASPYVGAGDSGGGGVGGFDGGGNGGGD